MEQRQDPHYTPGSQQPVYPQQQQPQQPIYPQPQQPPYPYQPYPAVAPRRGTFGRMLRLLTLRSFLGSASVGRRLRPYWFTVIIAAVLVCMIGVESFMLILPPLLRMASGQSSVRADSLPPAPAVESFIKGQREYNAALMWDAMSDELKSAQGTSQDSLQSEVEQERSSGQRYVKFDYVGGLRTRDGNSKFFYFAEVESPDSTHKPAMSYVFTVDSSGKITDISMSGT